MKHHSVTIGKISDDVESKRPSEEFYNANPLNIYDTAYRCMKERKKCRMEIPLSDGTSVLVEFLPVEAKALDNT